MRPYDPFKRAGFCRPKDYSASELYRIQDFEDEVTPESLATIMISVDAKRRSRRALQLLARIWSMTTDEVGVYDVHFNIHTVNNKPGFDMRESFREGYLEGPLTQGLIVEHLEAPIVGAYFQPYQPEYRESELQSILINH